MIHISQRNDTKSQMEFHHFLAVTKSRSNKRNIFHNLKNQVQFQHLMKLSSK